MNKNQIKIKNKMILNIRKSVEAQFNVIDSEKEKFISMTNISITNIYKKINVVEQILSDEEIDEQDVLMVIRKLGLVSEAVDSFIDLRKFVIQDIYNIISKNNGYRRAIENYINFLHGTTRNVHLLQLEYTKIQEQICELIMDSFNDITEEMFSILELKGFYDKLLTDVCMEAGKRKRKRVEAEKVKYEVAINDRHFGIYNYRELNQFAVANGFNAIRQTGSHKMFSNGSITVPIPQHQLGKGLSIAIQKQISNIA